MRLLLGLGATAMMAMAWLVNAEPDQAPRDTGDPVKHLEQESRDAGRTPIQDGDCD